MSVVKSLWGSIQGDPVFMRKINGWFTIFWIAMIPISVACGLLSSVTYVSALSLWALVSGHWSAWQAARVEVQQQIDAKALEDNPVEQRVLETIIEKTEVNLAHGEPVGQRCEPVAQASVSSAPAHPQEPEDACADVGAADSPGDGAFAPGDIATQLKSIAEQLSALQAHISQQL